MRFARLSSVGSKAWGSAGHRVVGIVWGMEGKAGRQAGRRCEVRSMDELETGRK